MYYNAEHYQDYTIIQTRDIFDRTESGKSWKRRPSTHEVEEIKAEQYLTTVRQIWRGDRVEYGYTYAGYIPVKLSNTSPNGAQKAVWSWSFLLK